MKRQEKSRRKFYRPAAGRPLRLGRLTGPRQIRLSSSANLAENLGTGKLRSAQALHEPIFLVGNSISPLGQLGLRSCFDHGEAALRQVVLL